MVLVCCGQLLAGGRSVGLSGSSSSSLPRPGRGVGGEEKAADGAGSTTRRPLEGSDGGKAASFSAPVTLNFSSWWSEVETMRREEGAQASSFKRHTVNIVFNTVDNSCEVCGCHVVVETAAVAALWYRNSVRCRRGGAMRGP